MSDYVDFLDFMPDTVTITPLLSTSLSGVPTYDVANPQSYSCRIEMGNHLVVDRNGREVTARGRIYLGTTIAPTITGLLTLPADFTVRNPPMIDSSTVDDESGPHHVVLEIG